MFVSVVIPLYNARDVIRETVASALAQTWQDFEIIVVDDGSSDGGGDLIQNLDARLRYVRQANAGVAAARNHGIALAKGEAIALLDHDDLWLPAKLERQVAVLQQRPEVGMVVTDVAHIDRAGRPLPIPGCSYNPDESFARLFVQGYVPTPSAAMIRKSVFEAVGGFDEAFGSAGMDDHELWPRIAAHCRIAGIPEPLTLHRNREIKPPQVALEHRPFLIARLKARFGGDREKRRYLVREEACYYADLGKHLLKQGKRKDGMAALRKGLALSLIVAACPTTAWRCLSRMTRYYFSAKSA
jgi:glycosyltransferase involved in cell wall biosynthesis